ncbi:MAG: C10 family peptidase [Candidatus Cryptobacteroides sp.]
MKILNHILKGCSIIGLFVVFSSCADSDSLDNISIIEEGSISIEQALSNLDVFYSIAYPNTKSTRKIESITKYSEDIITKSGEEKAVYLVNYSNNSGFAVLAAEPSVVDVVAVVENGHINDDLSVSVNNTSIDQIEVNDELTYFCVEDDDYYSDSNFSGSFVTDVIKNCIKYGEEDNFVPNPPRPYCEKSPLLNISWGQVDNVYSKYCRCVLSDEPALCGCSSTALAMIMASVEFPQTLYINGDLISWKDIKSAYRATELKDAALKEGVSKLCGMVFNYVKPNMITIPETSTMITPQQIKNVMSLFGFENVIKHRSNKLDKDMLSSISSMLRNNKPVFISAVPSAFWYAHSWVIDGAHYSSSTSSNYLLHFNFGWQGDCNGYYSISGLNPKNAVSYDTDTANNSEYDMNFMCGFRLLTYDIPKDSLAIQINYTW